MLRRLERTVIDLLIEVSPLLLMSLCALLLCLASLNSLGSTPVLHVSQLHFILLDSGPLGLLPQEDLLR